MATADEHNASLIVLGPHRRNGLLGHLQGSVAAAVVAHTATPVLIIPQRPTASKLCATAADENSKGERLQGSSDHDASLVG